MRRNQLQLTRHTGCTARGMTTHDTRKPALCLRAIIDGNERGPTLFFVQGWPDDSSLWAEQVAALGRHYRCVRVDLPNFGSAQSSRWGHSTEEIVEALTACLREVCPNERVTFIGHDWGAYWGHILHNRHPELISRFVGLDVAPHFRPTAKALAGILAYQWWLLLAFVIGGRAGDAMTRLFARLVRAPAASKRVVASMNYPYRNIWRDLLSGKDRRYVEGYWPEVPILFAFGTRKSFHFHSQNWLDHVRARAGGEVLPVQSGHWVMQAPEFTGALVRWLSSTA